MTHKSVYTHGLLVLAAVVSMLKLLVQTTESACFLLPRVLSVWSMERWLDVTMPPPTAASKAILSNAFRPVLAKSI